MAADAVPSLGLPPPQPLGGTATERALEEAAATGTLSLAGRRLRCFPDRAAQRWDLSDTTQADLSQNRLSALPPALLGLQCLELLSLSHNCLRSVPAHIANLSALTHLNVSRNQLRSLPPALCRLQLHVLLLSHNRLQRLPEAIGAMAALRQLDVSCNELRSLPPSMGRLSSLRDLNVRRNRITALPAELSLLPLVRLDFSCNHVTAIPRCFRRLRLLQALLCDHNPLQAPPPHVCLKGRVHIFKYLDAEPPDAAPPDAFTTGLPTELSPLRPRGGLDSGFNSVDSGSKRWSGNEFSDLTHGPKEKRSPMGGDSDLELLEGSTTGGEEEEDPPCTPPHPPGGSPVSVRWGGEQQKRPPRSLQLWKEREKGWRREKRSSDLLEPSTFMQQQTPGAPPPAALSAHHELPHPREAPRPNSFLFRVNKCTTAPPGGEEVELQKSTEALLPEKGGGTALSPPCRTPRTNHPAARGTHEAAHADTHAEDAALPAL